MQLLKQIWNYRDNPETAKTLRTRALRGLFVFLALMVCCTIVSRAADAMTIATVVVRTPERTTITQTVTADGVLESLDRVPVSVPNGVPVQSIAVSQGARVLTGDLLFTFDTAELQKELREKQLQLQRLQLELSTQRESQSREAEQQDLALERAREDLELAQENAERSVASAMDEMNQRRRDLLHYDGDDEDEDAYKRALESLRASYRSALRQYEQSLSDQAESLQRAERAIEDAASPGSPGIQADLLAVDIQLKQLEIATLQDYLSTEGQVFAPADGIVETLSVSAGGRTTSEAAALITGEGDLRLVATITEDEKKHVQRGSAVSLTLQGSERARDGFEVASVRPVTGSNNWELVVDLPAGTGDPGLSATVQITQRSQSYNSCVPLSALHQEYNQYYLLAIRENQSTLGLEQVVERINVSLEEKNERIAAVSGPLSSDTLIITSTDRPLAENDRVRVQS